MMPDSGRYNTFQDYLLVFSIISLKTSFVNPWLIFESIWNEIYSDSLNFINSINMINYKTKFICMCIQFTFMIPWLIKNSILYQNLLQISNYLIRESIIQINYLVPLFFNQYIYFISLFKQQKILLYRNYLILVKIIMLNIFWLHGFICNFLIIHNN